MALFEQVPSAELLTDTVTQTVIAVSTASTTILSAQPARKFLRIKNQDGGAAKVYIKLAATAATTTNSFELLVGQIYEEGVGAGGIIYTGEIRAISASGSVNVYVEERV